MWVHKGPCKRKAGGLESERKCDDKQKGERGEDVTLLALKMEEGAIGGPLKLEAPGASRRNHPCQHLEFSPVRFMSDL